MTIKHGSVSVGTTATSLLGAVTDDVSPLDFSPDARSLLISTGTGAASVFVGGPGVTTTAYGYELTAGVPLALDLAPGDVPWAIVASGTVTVHTLHSGV